MGPVVLEAERARRRLRQQLGEGHAARQLEEPARHRRAQPGDCGGVAGEIDLPVGEGEQRRSPTSRTSTSFTSTVP